jgi:hypothetical protein
MAQHPRRQSSFFVMFRMHFLHPFPIFCISKCIHPAWITNFAVGLILVTPPLPVRSKHLCKQSACLRCAWCSLWSNFLQGCCYCYYCCYSVARLLTAPINNCEF